MHVKIVDAGKTCNHVRPQIIDTDIQFVIYGIC